MNNNHGNPHHGRAHNHNMGLHRHYKVHNNNTITTMTFFSNHLLQATDELMKKVFSPKTGVQSKIRSRYRPKIDTTF